MKAKPQTLLLIITFVLFVYNKSKAEGLFSPPAFIENIGQLADKHGNLYPEIKFMAEMPGKKLYFKPHGIEFHFYRFEERGKDEISKQQLDEISIGNKASILDKMYLFRVDMEFVNSNSKPEIHGKSKGQIKRQYFLPHCPDGITDVNEYDKILYKDVYENIDLLFYFDNGQLKYDFIVHPKGNPDEIKIRYNGHESLELLSTGDLKIKTKEGILYERKPFSYQGDKENVVESSFVLNDGIIGFRTGKYDTEKVMVIDPIIHWATYYNNTYGSDTWTRPVFASDGSMFNVGYTYAPAYTIINPGAGAYIDPNKDGSIDLIIVKFDASHQLVWATYYGGNGNDIVAGHTDYGKSIAIDENDNLFIGGFANSGTTSFPTLDAGGGSFYQTQSKIHGETSFFLKFSSSGVRLWATMFQHENANTNSSGMRINGVVAKGSKLYFTGQTSRSNNNDIPLRTLAGAYNNSTFVGQQDAFVGRFSSNGVLEWCTYLNSGNVSQTAYAQGVDLAVDKDNNLFYIGRESYSSGNQKHYLLNPGGGAFYQAVNAGDQDITITRFNSSRNITWSTYYGGSLQDIPSMVETDNDGNVIIVCRAVRSTDFPTHNPGGGAYYQSTKAALGTASDAGIIKFSNTGVLQWATYYGGGGTFQSGATTYNAETLLSGVGVDNSNNLFFSGSTQSPLFPTQNQLGSYFSGTRNGQSDAVFLKFDNNGVRQWATYYGGSGNEGLYSGKGAVYNGDCESALVAFGFSNSIDFPTVNPGGGAFYETTSLTSSVNVIYYFTESTGALSIAPTSATATPSAVCAGNASTLSVTGGSLGSGATWVWYSGSCGGTPIGIGTTISVSPTTPTTYYVRAEGSCNTTDCASVTVNINANSVAPSSITAAPSTICAGDNSVITVNGGSLGHNAVWELYAGTCGGTLISSNTTGSFTVSPNTTTIYYIRANGDCNTTVCESVTVIVDELSVVPVSASASPSFICQGNTTTLSVTGGSLGSGATWAWYSGSCGGTPIGTGTTISVSPTTPTTYYVRAEGSCNTTDCASVTVNINANSVAPSSITSAPSTICAGDNSVITVNGGSLGHNAVWELYAGACGGTLISSNTTGSFTVSPNTTTTYYIRANGDCNTTVCESVTVIVDELSVVPVSASASPSFICQGNTTTLSVTGGSLGSGATWAWYSGSCGGTPIGTGTTISVSPTTPTTYYVRAEGSCNTTDCASVTVNINANSVAPSSITAAPSTICAGDNSVITVNGGSLGHNAVWELYAGTCGGTLISSNTTGSFTVSPNTTTTYYIRANGDCNTTGCLETIISVDEASITPLSITLSTDTICLGSDLTITVNGGYLGSGAHWELFEGICGGTPIISNSSGVFTVTPTANTNYFVQASGSCNTTDCVTDYITVINTPDDAGLISGPDMLCEGATNISYSVSGVANADNYSWTLPAGFIGNSTTNNITISTILGAASGTISVYASNSCGDGASADLNITVNPLPIVDFSPSITSYCLNETAVIITGGLPIGGSYSGNHVSGVNFLPSDAGVGSHVINYIYTDTNGCSSSDTALFSVNPIPEVSLSSFESICEDVENIELSGGLPLGGYYFGDFVNQNIFDIVSAGTGSHTVYYVFEDNNGCSDTANALIHIVSQVNLVSNLPNNTAYINFGTEVSFTALPPAQGTYSFYINTDLMQEGYQNIFTTATITHTSEVSVILNNACTDSLKVLVRPLPNAFTPFAANGLNDVFMPHVDLTIINRWGQELYKGVEGWNGTYKGKNVSPGTYYYIINLPGINGKNKQLTGSVTIVKKE